MDKKSPIIAFLPSESHLNAQTATLLSKYNIFCVSRCATIEYTRKQHGLTITPWSLTKLLPKTSLTIYHHSFEPIARLANRAQFLTGFVYYCNTCATVNIEMTKNTNDL